MRKEQKFKRGNLVHIAKNLGSMMSHFDNDKDAIVMGSYADQFGGTDTDSYTVMFVEDGNECSWYYESQLTLIDEGGEHLIEEANKAKERILKQDTDIKYIVSKLDDGNLSSESILLLFDMLGHDTSFHKNGEFFILFSEWRMLCPLFVHIKNANSLDEAQSVLTKCGRNNYNVEKVYNAFKAANQNCQNNQ